MRVEEWTKPETVLLMKPEQFKRWFNRSFWRVFKDQTLPIRIPQTPLEKVALIDNLYTAISSARYAGLPLLNRLLWANLESLPKVLFQTMVVRLTSDEYLLRANSKKLSRVHKLNRDRTRPVDFAKRLREIGERSVHNSYHYEVLEFARAVGDADLRRFCKARLASLDQLMNSL